MEAVKVSSKFQVVIPKSVRDAMNLQPGEAVQVFTYRGRIEMVPVRPARRMRGFLRGIDTSVPRDRDRV